MYSNPNHQFDHPNKAAYADKIPVSEAARTDHRAAASKHLYEGLERLTPHLGRPESDGRFIADTLELSKLSFVLGKGFGELVMYLQTALAAADRLGDRRSRALIKLHLGRLYYFAERRAEAIKAFSEGKAEVEELGDDDILTQSGEFLGLYFHMQGLFREAKTHFERGVESFESDEKSSLINPSAAMWLSYCWAYLGQFHQAIGSLDYYRRLALEKSDQTLATTLRSVLGLVLLMMKKTREAAVELSTALREATNTKNALALYFARGGIAYHHFLESRLQEARDWLAQTMAEGAGSGLVRQYASPFVLEMLYEFARLGLEPIPEFSFQREVHRLMHEPNIHLRGVALRLRAMEAITRGEDKQLIRSDLEASEDYLKRSGDPVQLAKTRLVMARLKLEEGDEEGARILARKAWRGFSGYGDEFYPDDLRHLLAKKDCSLRKWDAAEEFTHRFLNMIEDLSPGIDLNSVLNRAVAATNRFFGAERGGIFWFNTRKSRHEPVLLASRHLAQGEVQAEGFRSNLALVFKASREKAPQVVRLEGGGSAPHRVKAILCLPFEVEGCGRGVLYHDNSYLKDCFELFDQCQLGRMSRYLADYFAQVWSYCRRKEEKASEASMTSFRMEQSNHMEIITQSQVMRKVLEQADRAAASESTVLIIGETGVGKELLAQRLHQMSLRRDGPFVVVDPTTIPENLVESELFGYEKGAFTGADRQKKGRMELAHKGTLFIDEVGEIPRHLQAKLLRVIQEKTLYRLGGTQPISSDFRLLAATNRDLAAETAAGRFREDLYYRLNVVPLTIPTLRERTEDILLLAEHFLMRYAGKYNRPLLKITSEDETRLLNYPWPGNVRELQNVIERAVLLSTDERLELNLPTEAKSAVGLILSDQPTLDELQRRYIRYVLNKTEGRISGPGGAAELLGMKRSSLYNRMKKLGLR